MPGFLERLRKKPHETRKRYALGTSATVTGLIFIMWLTVLNHGFLGDDQEVRSLNNTDLNQTASPLAAFSDNAASAFQQLRDGFRDLDEGVVSTTSDSQATTVESELPNRSATGKDTTPSADDYWATAGDTPMGTSERQAVMGATDEPDSSEETPFNSRNYNPQQESDWFSQ